jgi:hypothetical protein
MSRLQSPVRTCRARYAHLALACNVSMLCAFGCSDDHADVAKPARPGETQPLERDPKVLARAAAVIGACFPDDGVNRNLSHLWSDGERLWQRFARAADCIAAAGGGCEALHTCIGWTLTPDTSGSCASCDGEVATRCGDGMRLTIDCARLGLKCDALAVCSEAPAAACDRATFETRCSSDGTPEYCDDGVVFRGAECKALGLECAGGDCVGTGDACTTSAGLSEDDMNWDGRACVDASTLKACVGGRTEERDCSAVGPGFTCQTFGQAFFCGLGSECLPGELPGMDQRGTAETCDDGAVVFCNAGRLERVACTDLGFKACDASARGCVPGPASATSRD